MRGNRWILSAVLSMACAVRVPPGPVPVEEGMRPVLVEEWRDAPEAWDMEITVVAGSRFDPVGREGLSWVVAQTQAERMSGLEVRVKVERERVRYMIACGNVDPAACGDQVSGAFTRPLSPDEALKQPVKTLWQEPTPEVLLEAFDRWVYPGHPYGHGVWGRTGALSQLTFEAALAFQRKHYRRINTSVKLGVSGEELRVALVQGFTGLPAGLPPDMAMMRPEALDARTLGVSWPVVPPSDAIEDAPDADLEGGEEAARVEPAAEAEALSPETTVQQQEPGQLAPVDREPPASRPDAVLGVVFDGPLAPEERLGLLIAGGVFSLDAPQEARQMQLAQLDERLRRVAPSWAVLSSVGLVDEGLAESLWTEQDVAQFLSDPAVEQARQDIEQLLPSVGSSQGMMEAQTGEWVRGVFLRLVASRPLQVVFVAENPAPRVDGDVVVTIDEVFR